MNKGRAIMFQGTGSGVGKSIMVSAFCRILYQDGYSVAPFKSQNMALNSHVTLSGGEIGRAQASQALAAKINATVEMNPVLLKPSADRAAQVILMGRPVKNMSVYEYKDYKKLVIKKITGSFKKLSSEYDIVVLEGAGSPAEVNLKEHDIVNMKMASIASAPVILVADIDKGGVFAWVIGTLELLSEEERKRVKGIIINKFRGDKRLVRSGITFLERYTGIKVLGVVPYYHNIKIPEEDSVPLDSLSSPDTAAGRIKVRVIYLPHISNFTDFDTIERERDVDLQYVKDPAELDGADLIIIPGSKSTVSDLKYIRRKGFAKKISEQYRKGSRILGICGGFQMLGESIKDRHKIESSQSDIKGLCLLPVETSFQRSKKLAQVDAVEIETGFAVKAYEIHHGRTRLGKGCKHIFEVRSKKSSYADGAQSEDGKCMGTYLHGAFDNDQFRTGFLNKIRKDRSMPCLKKTGVYNVDREFDRLARHVRKNVDMDCFYSILKEV